MQSGEVELTQPVVDETHVLVKSGYLEEIKDLLQEEVGDSPPCSRYRCAENPMTAGEEHLYPGPKLMTQPYVTLLYNLIMHNCIHITVFPPADHDD